MLVVSPDRWQWLGSALSLWPILFFFGMIMASGKGRAATVMKGQLFFAMTGMLVSALNYQTVPFLYSSLLGLAGILLYDRWYTIMPPLQQGKLAANGIRLVVVSGQPVQETRQLAKQFSVPFEFYADPGGKAAKEIGIQHEQGNPLGMVTCSPDTVIPTVVICDAAGVIRYLDVAENYRDRPIPETLLNELGIG